ncbi:MAG: hypothetical protein QOF97_252, partial [Acidimicrobiaceae bacterium]
VVEEFGVDIEYQSDLAVPVVLPKRYWSDTRFGARQDLVTTQRMDDDDVSRMRQLGRRLAARLGRST